MILMNNIDRIAFGILHTDETEKGKKAMAKKNTYDAGSIAILEGLEAVRETSRECISEVYLPKG